jgi:DNA-binding MarR family transcriptional regulator
MPNTQEKNYLVLLADIVFRLFTNCQKKEERFVSNYEISAVEFRCIWFLNEQKETSVKELAQKMSLSSSRITRIIDGLFAYFLKT